MEGGGDGRAKPDFELSMTIENVALCTFDFWYILLVSVVFDVQKR